MESGDKYKASMRSLSAQPDKFSGKNYYFLLALNGSLSKNLEFGH